MRVLIAFEASHQRGLGHLYRSLSLANALRARGHETCLVANAEPAAIAACEAADHRLVGVAELAGSDWQAGLVQAWMPDLWVDDRLDTSRAHGEVLGSVPRVTFDDAGEGGITAQANICALVPPPARPAHNACHGPDYLVLDPRIATWPSSAGLGVASPVLMTFGGSDTHGLTPRLLAALGGLGRGFDLQVVTGPAFRHHEDLRATLATLDFEVDWRQAVPDLLSLIAAARIVVCAGGITAHEVAALGKAALVVASEPHEVPSARYLASRGGCRYLGYREEAVEVALAVQVRALVADPAACADLGAAGRAVVDGRGLERVVAIMEAQA